VTPSSINIRPPRSRIVLSLSLAGAMAAALTGMVAAPASAATAAVQFSGRQLNYTAAAGEANDLNITQTGTGSFTISDPGANIAPGENCSGGGTSVTCSSANTDYLYIILGDGDDTATVDSALSATIEGSDGNDTITVLTGTAYVNGGAGDDTLTTSDGGGQLVGEAGDDTLIGQGGTDEAFGGPGSDICREFKIDHSCGRELGPPPLGVYVVLNEGLDGVSLIVQGDRTPNQISISEGGGGYLVGGDFVSPGEGCTSTGLRQASCKTNRAVGLIIALSISSSVVDRETIAVRSTTDPVATGARIEKPLSLPFSSGRTRPTAFAAPVVVGIRLSAAARARRRSLCGMSCRRWSAV